jgi:hypothetical protein
LGGSFSTNNLYGDGGDSVNIIGGDNATNNMFAGDGNGVVMFGGNAAANVFDAGKGSEVMFGGQGSNFYNFLDPASYLGGSSQVVHGSVSAFANDTLNLSGVGHWTINLNVPGDAAAILNGYTVAGVNQLSGTAISTIGGNTTVITFDHIETIHMV